MKRSAIQSKSGFTMIEVLAVMAIIGTLAALVIGGAGAAGAARMKARARGELATLETVIEAYKNDQGFYPPGGKYASGENKPELPPLYYELSGTKRFDNGDFSTLAGDGDDRISGAAINDVFGLSGFANSNPETAKRYFSSLKPGQHAAVKNTAGANVRVLTIPIEGPATPEVLSLENNSQRLNTWRYVSDKPTNNPASFDLWVDIIVRKETNTIGNWKE